jgi:hypothetical protein
MAARKLRPVAKKRTKRGPTDKAKAAKARELFRYWQETERLRDEGGSK